MALVVSDELHATGCRTCCGADPVRQRSGIREVVGSDLEPIATVASAGLLGAGDDPTGPAKEAVSKDVALPVGTDDELGRRRWWQRRPTGRLRDRAVSAGVAQLSAVDADTGG